MPLRSAVRGLLVLLACGSASAQLQSIFPGVHVPIEPPGVQELGNLRVADIDGDGLVDLVLEGFGGGTGGNVVEVLRGLPAGGYAPPVVSNVAGTKVLVDLTTGDLDGDAWLDIAGVTSNQRIVVAHGQADGSLIESYEYFSGNGVPVEVAISDMNHDGRGDVVSATDATPGVINVNLADGGGGYLATQAWTAGIKVSSMAVTDLDADGWPDVLACYHSLNTLAVLNDDGAGGLLAPQLLPAATRTQRVLAGPLDGDADMDALIIASGAVITSPGSVQPWLGDGTGALVAQPSVTVGLFAQGGVLGDLDGDGDLDAVVTAGGPDNINVLLNDGAAQFSVTPLQLGFGGATVLADASGDGLLDMLYVSGPDVVGIIPASAPGVFPSGDNWFNLGELPQGFDVGFVDGDDRPDVVVSWLDSPGMGTLLDSATGLQTTPVLSAGYTTCQVLRVGDLNGDGFADLVCSPNPTSPPRIQFGRGLGTGVFAPPQELSWTGTLGNARELAMGDVNGDGWRDVVGVAWDQNNTLLTFLNPGNGSVSFPAPILLGVGPSTGSVQTGDVDGDGYDDAVLTRASTPSGQSDELLVLPGGRTGILLPGPTSPMPPLTNSPWGLVLADMDLDGELDAVVAESSYPARIAVALGDGAGSFQFSDWETGMLFADSLDVADVNGDAWPDVVHGPGGGNAAVVLRLGDGKGGLLPPQTTSASIDTERLMLADFNHDGRPDLLAETYSSSPMPSRVGFLPNIAAPFTWKDLGFALAGASGEPRLVGTGELLPGTPGFLRLSQANPSAPAVLFIAPTAIPTPFKGGTLVPLPPLAAFAFFLDADGSVELAWNSWPSNHPGQSWYFQFGIQDGGGPHGAALSNAISGTEP